MTEYVRSMAFTLSVDTNKQTYTFEGDTWDALRLGWQELAENDIAPPLPDSAPLPVVREEDGAVKLRWPKMQKDLAWLRMLANDEEGHPRYRAHAKRILEALATRQGGAK